MTAKCKSQTSDKLNNLQDPDDTSGRAGLQEGILVVGNSVCEFDMGAEQFFFIFFCGTPGVEDRPSNYVHGRLLFLNRWVGCCRSAVWGFLSLSLDAPETL